MRRAAQEQVEVSQRLIKAAMDQVEGLSKPCLTLWAELRDRANTILEMHGAVGSTIVRADGGHFVVQNIGNGVALNVSYAFSPVNQSDGPTGRTQAAGYLQNVLANQKITMAEPVTAFTDEYKAI